MKVSEWDKNEHTNSILKEYKEEAVSLVPEQGYSVPEAAKSLGIASNMLYRWKEQIESQRDGKSLSPRSKVFDENALVTVASAEALLKLVEARPLKRHISMLSILHGIP